MTRYTIVLSIFLISMYSCKEGENDSIPVITYQAPEYLSAYVVYDSVPVRATITDEQDIQNVRVNLTNSDFISVTPSQVFYPASPSYELNTVVLLDDVLLESGHYYVLIRADNGTNFKNQYQEIIVQGLEQEFKQVVVVTEGSGNTMDLWGSEDLDIATSLSTLEGDFTASAISSQAKLLFIAGENILNLLAFNLESNTLEWKKQQTPGLPMHNPGCLHFDGLLYTTYNFNFIHGYSISGQVQYDVFIDEFDAPQSIYKHGDYILTEYQKKNAINPFIATTFALTGAEKQRRLINEDVIGFFSLEGNEVLIVFNSESKGSIYLYDVQQDLLTFRKDIPEQINAAVEVSGNTLVLAGNEHIYAFTDETGAFTPILDNGASILAWEAIQELLLTGDGNKLEGFSYPEMVNQKTLLFSDTILDIQIQYTK